jgi:hypothetical protein
MKIHTLILAFIFFNPVSPYLSTYLLGQKTFGGREGSCIEELNTFWALYRLFHTFYVFRAARLLITRWNPDEVGVR